MTKLFTTTLILGYWVTLNVNNDYISKTAFVSKGDSIAENGADLLCAIYDKVKSD